MAAYIGSVEGSRGPTTRTGGEGSGVRSNLAGWSGGVVTHLRHEGGVPWLSVRLVTHQGAGREGILYDGPLADAPIKTGR